MDYLLLLIKALLRRKNFFLSLHYAIINKSSEAANLFGRVAQFGRAPRSQRGGRRFDPDHVHHLQTTHKRGFFVRNEARSASEGAERALGTGLIRNHLQSTHKRGFFACNEARCASEGAERARGAGPYPEPFTNHAQAWFFVFKPECSLRT